jgi:hypothetical protein
MAKVQGLTTYRINKKLTVRAWWEDTRYGFRHLAQLIEGERTIGQAKACYYNRTWEQYDYQSVIHALIDNSSLRNKNAAKKRIDAQALGEVDQSFKTLAAVMAVGEVLTDDLKESNDFKLRMLKAQFGNGLIIPADWDDLPEQDKATRLKNIEREFSNVNQN